MHVDVVQGHFSLLGTKQRENRQTIRDYLHFDKFHIACPNEQYPGAGAVSLNKQTNSTQESDYKAKSALFQTHK